MPKARATAKKSKPEQKKLGTSASSIAVAAALRKHFPEEAQQIVQVMGEAATSRSMKRRLARMALAFESLPKNGR